MNALIESTKQVFGDRADALLESGSIMPVTKDKTPAMRGNWRNPTDPARFNGQSHYGYAIKTGEVSGLTGVDFDGLIIPERYNTQTLRGFHSWVPYEPGDTNKKNINGSKVDIRGEGGFLVFASPTHSVVRPGLLSRDDFLEWLHPASLYTNTSGEYEYVWSAGSQHPYVKEITAHGYEVRLDWLASRLASTMRNAPEGSRNHTLYVFTSQLTILGGTAEHAALLRGAAYEAGLEGREIQMTMNSAQNGTEVIPVFHTARAWAEKADTELKRRRVKNTIVTEHMVRLATEQHSLRPLVSIQSLEQETGLTRKTIGNQLNMLIKEELLAKKVNPGRQPNGNLHPNNYIIMGGN